MPKFALSDLSMDDRSQLLSRALSKEVGEYDCYLREVYDTYLVYYDYDEGGCYKVTYAIADDYTVTFGTPEAVIGRTVYEPVKMSAFSLGSKVPATSGAVNVYPNSLLFEIQTDSEHFPNQGITVTKQDLADIARSFSGATMGLEHLDTVLGDACGDIRAVWLDHTGRRLFGDVAIPKGLDALIPPGPRRVSVEISRDAAGKMSIPKVDLVLNPQIERAALMSLAAFATKPNLSSLSTASLETKPMPIPTPNAPQTPKPSLWDQIKAAFKDHDIDVDGAQPAHLNQTSTLADPAVAEFRRKADLHDAAFAGRRQEAKKLAVIGFDDVKAARFGKLLDDAPEGPLFDELEAQAKDAAAKIAPPEGGRRTSAPPAFGSQAIDADTGARSPDTAPKLESNSALFARRAGESRRGSAAL